MKAETTNNHMTVTSESDGHKQLFSETQKHADRIRTDVIIDAHTLAEREYTISYEELEMRIGAMGNEYEEVYANIGITLNPDSQQVLGSQEAKEYQKQIDALCIKQGDVAKEIQHHPARDKQRPPELRTYDKVLMKAPYVILLLDASLESPALRYLVGPMLWAVPSAIGINVGKYFLSKFLSSKIEKAKTTIEKRTWFALGIIAFGTIAIVLGFFRQQYLIANQGESHYGPLPLGLLSFILSMSSWIAEMYASKVRRRQRILDDENRVFDEFDKLVEKQASRALKIRTIEQVRNSTLGARVITMDNAKILREFLQSHYEGTAVQFQTELRVRRNRSSQNGEMPFMKDIPPLFGTKLSNPQKTQS